MSKDPDAKEKATKLRKHAEERLKRSSQIDSPKSTLETQRLLHELQVHQIELEMQNEALEEARAELEAGFDRFTELYDFAPANYFTLLPDSTIREANLPGARLLGIDRARLIHTKLRSFISPETRPVFDGWLSQIFSGKGGGDCIVTLCGEKPLTLELEATPSPDGGEVRAILTDITRRRALEEQMRRGQKMEVVGQLAGGAAHDFNNILAAMILNLDMLETQFELPKGAGALVYNVHELANRAAGLTRQLLVFSERQAMKAEPIEINAAIIPLIKMVESLPGAEITCERRGDLGELWIEADAGMMDQVVINICLNARDAMPQGGRLTVETAVEFIGPDQIPCDAQAHEGRFVCLKICDTGSGMPKEVMEHAFEPFFTTKDIGKGTGLGLACAHSTVRQHGGWITLDSEPGKGTSVRVFLPLTLGKTPSREVPLESKSQSQGLNILLVEDELSLRQMAATTLTMLGYTVLAAANGPQALELWEKSQGEIDLLLTDMRMPKGISGMQLAQTLLALKPSLKVIIMSGYSLEIVRQDVEGTFPYTFLPKPFNLKILSEVLARGLAAPGVK